MTHLHDTYADRLHPVDVSGNQLTEVARYAQIDNQSRYVLARTLAEVETIETDPSLSAVGKAAKLEALGKRFSGELERVEQGLSDAKWHADVWRNNTGRPRLDEVSPVAEQRLSEMRGAFRNLEPNHMLHEVNAAEADRDGDLLRALFDAPRIIRFGDKETDRLVRERAQHALLRLQRPEHADAARRLDDVQVRAVRNAQLVRQFLTDEIRMRRAKYPF